MFKDTKELRKMIMENPTRKLLVLGNEDSFPEGSSFSQGVHCRLAKMASYEARMDKYILDEEDYEEYLTNDMGDMKEYKNLSMRDFMKEVEKEMEKVNFEEVILIEV